MNKAQKEFIKELNGMEIFFRDIGVVAIKDSYLI